MNLIKSVGFGVVAVAAMFVSSSAFAARDLVWLGSDDATTGTYWDLVTPNWYVKGDATKTRVCFESGDNVWFLDSEWVSPTAKLIRTNTSAWQHEYDIGDVVISNETETLTWGSNGNTWVDKQCFPMKSLNKWGAGAYTTTSSFGFAPDYHIHQGSFYSKAGGSNLGDERGDMGSVIVSRAIYFHPGTTYDYSGAGGAFGGVGNAGKMKGIYFTNAVFKISGKGGSPSIPRAFFHNTTFDIIGSSDYNDNNISLFFTGDLTFTGDKAVTIPRGRPVNFGKRVTNSTVGPIDIRVADMTGNADSDLIVPATLGNVTKSGNDVTHEGRNCFRKTGPGTMEISYGMNMFTGSVEVAEGELVFSVDAGGTDVNYQNYKRSAVGPVDGPGVANRAITVDPGAALSFKGFAMGLVDTPASLKITVNGGTLNMGEAGFTFGDLELNNATVNYTSGNAYGWFHYGLWSFGKRLKVSGSTPYDFGVRGKENFFTLGFTLASTIEDHPDPTIPETEDKLMFTNLLSEVELDVADITGNAAADLSIGQEVRDTPNMSYPSYSGSVNNYKSMPWRFYRFRGGIRKTGAGTLRLYHPKNTYTHTTKVEGGTLVVDGSIATSSAATVEAGAYLGGTGTVCAVTLKANGGIEVDAAKPDHLKVPSIDAAGAASVKIVGAENPASLDGRALFEITGKPAAFDLTDWRVDYGGTGRTRGVKLAYDPSTGIVSATRGGMLMIFK